MNGSQADHSMTTHTLCFPLKENAAFSFFRRENEFPCFDPVCVLFKNVDYFILIGYFIFQVFVSFRKQQSPIVH